MMRTACLWGGDGLACIEGMFDEIDCPLLCDRRVRSALNFQKTITEQDKRGGAWKRRGGRLGG
jgi:hypothetical protein